VPEPKNRTESHFDFLGQVDWEERCLHLADVVMFWMPRDLAVLPGFTSNVEWGMWYDSGRVVLGAPPDAPKNRYILHYASKNSVPVSTALEGVVDATIEYLGGGAYRRDGERCVPLLIWRTTGFAKWYAAQRGAGNRLTAARVAWSFGSPVFFWALHVEIYVTSEGRIKANEIVICRPDISAVVLYRRGASVAEMIIVLVKEFRSSASGPDGFVHELPSGSGPGTAVEQAIQEVHEEVGLLLTPDRIRVHGNRQISATLSVHRAHLYSAEITDAELDQIRALPVLPGPMQNERITPEIMTFGDIVASGSLDWAMLGMIVQVVNEIGNQGH
jgi:hypothetical protein